MLEGLAIENINKKEQPYYAKLNYTEGLLREEKLEHYTKER